MSSDGVSVNRILSLPLTLVTFITTGPSLVVGGVEVVYTMFIIQEYLEDISVIYQSIYRSQ